MSTLLPSEPYRPGRVLNPAWSQPDRAAISTDNITWSQTDECRREEDGSAVYKIEAPAEQIWLAWGPPFLPSHAEELLARIANESYMEYSTADWQKPSLHL